MELREYASVLFRRWWLILLLPLLAGLFSLLTYQEPTIEYGYDLQYSVSFLPIRRETLEQDPRLGAVQVSEYVADDLTEIFRSSRFASFVQQYLPEGQTMTLTQVIRAEKAHRLVTIGLIGATEQETQKLADAFVEATENDLQELLDDLWGTGEVQLELVNEQGPYTTGDSLRSVLDIPLRVALALIAAVALAFLLDYLDDSIRSRREAEALVGTVLAEIPK